MPRTLRIALAQFDFPVGDVEGNARRIAALVAEARDVHKADLVLFPELALSGYPPEDLVHRPAFLAACEQALHGLARACTGIAAVVGWPEAAGPVVYNAASLLRDGRVEATYRKRELPNYAVFDERRYFAVDPDGGPLVFEHQGVQVGLVTCGSPSPWPTPPRPAPSWCWCPMPRPTRATRPPSAMPCWRSACTRPAWAWPT
jgi:NAD+ synthase (glutamine-hydrolysing)